MHDIVESTKHYEHWLGEQIELVQADLEHKHELMAGNAFAFFRATYYRWLERIGDVAPELGGPRVAAVGDLHAENFGTWRDAEGRLVWGVNDFDESEQLAYTFDLARLATSALLAIKDAGLELEPDDACSAILEGYARTLADGGLPFVLSGDHERLELLVQEALPDPAGWWKKLLALDPGEDLPPAAHAALTPLLPDPDWSYEIRRRVAGVGSLGHRRLVVVGDRDGAPAARELKQLAPPSGRWLGRAATAAMRGSDAVRSPDPLLAVRGEWLARRLAPDCVKLDLSTMKHRARERRLFEWMGAETANVHLGSPDQVAAIRADLEQRGEDWLLDAARRLAEAAGKDYADWRHHAHG